MKTKAHIETKLAELKEQSKIFNHTVVFCLANNREIELLEWVLDIHTKPLPTPIKIEMPVYMYKDREWHTDDELE